MPLTKALNLANLAREWAAGAGVTQHGIKLNVTDTASAADSLLMDLQVGGVTKFSVRKDGKVVAGEFNAGNGSLTAGSLYFSSSQDVALTRDAAHILAQRNGANAQAFRLSNTYIDAANYERLTLAFESNVAHLRTDAGGTGTVRSLYLRGGHATTPGGIRLINSTVVLEQEIGFAPTLGAAPNARLSANAANVLRLLGTSGNNGAFEFGEMTAPSAPAANIVRFYAEDNGSGKTRLMALFASGAAQQLAIEP